VSPVKPVQTAQAVQAVETGVAVAVLASGDDGSVERDEKGEEAEDESIGNMMVYPQKGKKTIAREGCGGEKGERDGRMEKR
jgi:hypothetical protein